MSKKILPKATKSSMVKLVRAKGYDVPSLYQAVFERMAELSGCVGWTRGKFPIQRTIPVQAAGRCFRSIRRGSTSLWRR